MKRILSLIVVMGACGLMLTNCRHDGQLPEQQVSFSADILPIIQLNCQHDGCHGTQNTSEFELMTYEDVMDHGKVKAGNPKDSKLYQAVTGSGEEFMPAAPYPALSERNLKLIYIWIGQGAKNN